ncbi:hypothetical protein DRO66_10455 [Candidatus Bathyarchaeota archaeon]|nr:MAG: hypothetical protein DRO66_10455 [Candidatus Bathyarchaeota archaeon]
MSTYARAVHYHINEPGPPDIGLANATAVLKTLLNKFPRVSGRFENVNGCADVMLIILKAKAHRTISSIILNFILHYSFCTIEDFD